MLSDARSEPWGRPGDEFGGTEKFFSDQDFLMTVFSEKNSIFTAKISDDFFLVIDQLLISSLFCVILTPFLTRKTPFLLCSDFRSHPATLLLKILGGRMHGRTPTSNVLGNRPPSSP